jgi:dTDP-4-amino-4,6-dideoxygalactose transaminase
MKVPFMNLSDSYVEIYDDAISRIQDLIKSTQFIGGKEIENFENEFAKYCNCNHAIACGNGTDAIIIALKALGIGNGDIVITVPNTFIATSEAITAVGAEVRFVDVDEDRLTMSPSLLENYLKNSNEIDKIKALIPVHIFGQMCEMDKICDIAQRYGLKVIEDSAQAHGAKFKGKGPGEYGDIATFSFYPGKNLGAFGDAGALITNDSDLYIKIKKLTNHGRIKKYEHEIEGYNSRMDSIQAAILRIKLSKLDKWTNERRMKVERYLSNLQMSGIKLPHTNESYYDVYHLFVIRLKGRDKLMNELKEDGVSTGIHYPLPLHLQKAYEYLGYKKGDFPITEKASQEILSLPLWPEISNEQIDYVTDRIFESIRTE